VELVARDVESRLERLAEHPRVKEVDEILASGPANPFAGDCVNASQVIMAAKVVLKAAQLPARAMDAVRDAVVAFYDAAGVVDPEHQALLYS
jgi:hypothetical protein